MWVCVCVCVLHKGGWFLQTEWLIYTYIILYHMILYYIIFYHIVLYYHIILYYFILDHIIVYDTKLYYIILHYTIWYRYHILSYHVISYHIILYDSMSMFLDLLFLFYVSMIFDGIPRTFSFQKKTAAKSLCLWGQETRIRSSATADPMQSNAAKLILSMVQRCRDPVLLCLESLPWPLHTACLWTNYE